MKSQQQQMSIQFMLKEYERISSLKVREDQQAEHRVDFFLSIASAAIGAIIFLSQISNIPRQLLYDAAEGVLIILLIFGIATINRLCTRSLQLLACSKLLLEIQNYFGKHDPEIATYVKFHAQLFKDPGTKSILSEIRRRLRISLVELMMFSTSLIGGGIALVALSFAGQSLQAVVGWTIVAVILSLVVLRFYYNLLKKILFPFSF